MPSHDHEKRAQGRMSIGCLPFSDGGFRRKACVVYLETRFHRVYAQGRDLVTLRGLKMFSEVVFRVLDRQVCRQDMGKEAAPVHGREFARWTADESAAGFFSVLGEWVVPALGEAEQGLDDEGPFLRFKPAALAAESYGEKENEQEGNDRLEQLVLLNPACTVPFRAMESEDMDKDGHGHFPRGVAAFWRERKELLKYAERESTLYCWRCSKCRDAGIRACRHDVLGYGLVPMLDRRI